MWQIVTGIFFVLHGLVHLLYTGQSTKLFQLQPGMTWPDGSWAFSRLLGDELVRSVAGVSCVLAAMGFVAGGIAIFAAQAWWRPVVIGSAAFSALIYILLWDGQLNALANKGLFAIIINFAVLAAVLILRWPRFSF